MSEYLTSEEVDALILRVSEGDNDAWESLYNNFKRYVASLVKNKLCSYSLYSDKQKDMFEDLYQAGWEAFVRAVRRYTPGKAKFSTYVTTCINGEISKQLSVLFNSMGFSHLPKYKNHNTSQNGADDSFGKIEHVSLEAEDGYIEAELYRLYPENDITGIEESDLPDNAGFTDRRKKLYNAVKELADEEIRLKDENRTQTEAELKKLFDNYGISADSFSQTRRTLQILEVLRLATDEEHTLTKETLGKALRRYRMINYENGNLESDNTLTSVIEDILLEMNPEHYREENDRDYKIKYNGYENDLLYKKLNKESGKKTDITDYSYVHLFNNENLDKLIQIICFSDMLTSTEKEELIGRLYDTASMYYENPYWKNGVLAFNPKGIHSRSSCKNSYEVSCLANNLKVLQGAVNSFYQVRFKFNRYTVKHELVPTTDAWHILSPYHLVRYHDNYYCIGLKNNKNDRRIWHYRVDLMTDLDIIKDEDGHPVPIEVSSFEGLPILNSVWNPEKYMSEHLNMAYDEPRDIKVKILNIDYTMLHDWFGNNYERLNEECEEGFDIVQVRTSPSMLVHLVMQYGTIKYGPFKGRLKLEVMDEDIREEIRNEIKAMGEKYGREDR